MFALCRGAHCGALSDARRGVSSASRVWGCVNLVITIQGACPEEACAPSLYSGASVSPPTPCVTRPSSLLVLLRVPKMLMCVGYHLGGQGEEGKVLGPEAASEFSSLPAPRPAPLLSASESPRDQSTMLSLTELGHRFRRALFSPPSYSASLGRLLPT